MEAFSPFTNRGSGNVRTRTARAPEAGATTFHAKCASRGVAGGDAGWGRRVGAPPAVAVRVPRGGRRRAGPLDPARRPRGAGDRGGVARLVSRSRLQLRRVELSEDRESLRER